MNFKLLFGLAFSLTVFLGQAQTFDRNVYYRLTTQWQGEGKSLDVVNDGKAKNKLQLAKTGAYTGQYWKIQSLGKGFFRLTTQWQGEGKSLDVVNDGKNNNQLQLANTGKFSGQYWKITPVSGGYYRLTTQWQGEGKSLDVVNDGKANNKLQLAPTGKFSGQLWKITPIPAGPDQGAVTAEIEVNTPFECQTALINVADLKSQEYAWWYKWHEIKKAGQYKKTPHTYTNVAEGEYVLVIYDSFAEKRGTESDGVVLEKVVVKGGAKLRFDIKKSDYVDWNCLSCPWLYVYDGKEYVRLTEVIQDVVGEANCQTSKHQIPASYVIDGKLKIRIQEEKQETSYLDRVGLVLGDKTLSASLKKLSKEDKKYLKLEKGEAVDLEFAIEAETLKGQEHIVLECNGFYIPKKEFLEEVYEKYLRKDGKGE